MQDWLPRPALNGPLRDWLTARGSLSERLRACCGGFRVVPVRQTRARACLDETRLLGLPLRSRPLVREVVLYCGGTPVVFARSIAAAADLNGAWRALRGLGSQPLATMLFADPRIARGALHYRRLDARQPLYRHAARACDGLPATLWARRSVFRREDAPLLVSEVFLPGVLTL